MKLKLKTEMIKIELVKKMIKGCDAPKRWNLVFCRVLEFHDEKYQISDEKNCAENVGNKCQIFSCRGQSADQCHYTNDIILVSV